MPPQPPKASLQTIADQAGVSRAAVSLALRDQPGISEVTRERIKEIARTLGYLPNPMVSALMAHLKGLRPVSDVGSIPFLTAYPTRHGWREFSTFLRYYAGASERAQQAGYHLAEVWMREPGMNARKMRSILVNRGVQGILIAPLPKGLGHLSMDVSPFAVATLGHSLVRPKLHRAVHRHIDSLRSAIHHLRHLGYRRIGLALDETQDRRNDFNWTTAYAGYQHTRPQKEHIPIFNLNRQEDVQLGRWLEKWQPDALLSGSAEILGKLAKMGISAPADVGVVVLDLGPGDVGVAGIDQKPEFVGAAAMDMIVAQINSNERGIPENPKLILTEGIWVPGETIRKVNATSGSRPQRNGDSPSQIARYKPPDRDGSKSQARAI